MAIRLLLVTLVAVSACSGSAPQSQTSAEGAASSSRQVPIGQLPSIDTAAVLNHIKVLASDEYEGRAPGTKGEELTVRYLTEQFKAIGLKPGNPDGTYVQKVPLVGITPAPAPLVFKKNGRQQTLKWKDDVAVKVLVQAIEISRAIAEEQRRRPILTPLVTPLEKAAKTCRIVTWERQCSHPLVRTVRQ